MAEKWRAQKVHDSRARIPSNKDFLKEVKKYHDIEHVRADGKLSTGLKELQLKETQ
jgi:hypothetical protein